MTVALIKAVRSGDVSAFKSAIESLSPADVTPVERWNYLHKVFMSPKAQASEEMVRHLLRWGVDPSLKDVYGNSPLYYAIRQDNVPAVRLLLEKGVDVNQHNAENVTPLKLALSTTSVNLDLVQLLLDAQANIFERYGPGYTIWSSVERERDQKPALFELFSRYYTG